MGLIIDYTIQLKINVPMKKFINKMALTDLPTRD